MKNLSIQVIGRVQGVWFRKFTKDKASSLGLKGFVKNQVDGSVYIEASGPDDKMDYFAEWCWEGSPLSHVEEVIVTETNKTQEKTFTIKS